MQVWEHRYGLRMNQGQQQRLQLAMAQESATNALIAQLIAQDRHHSYAEERDERWGDSDDADPQTSDSSSRSRNLKAKRRAGRTAPSHKRSRPIKTAQPSDKAAPIDGQEDDDKGDGGEDGARRRRSDVGKQRAAGRPWNDQEECLFLQALETHGRNWKACSDLIPTRDADAIKSHAQRHFVKLCMKGKTLPTKVLASGTGYTLSGNPLDPSSAGAIQNGFRLDLFAKLSGDELQIAKSGLLLTKLPVSLGGSAAEQDAPSKPAARLPKKAAPRKAKAPAAVTPGPPQGDPDAAAETKDPPEPTQRTDYALARPKRNLARQQLALAATSESQLLVQPLEFIGQPGSGAPLAQPFHMTVQAEALAVADLHAHLSDFEIIGLLGGRWDDEAQRLDVLEAYPCRCSPGSQAANAVELDPVSEVEVRAVMEEAGQRCVGWYHSHPVFEPRPSQKDMENQRNYQALFRDAKANEPFVGFIIGPYDLSMLGPTSAITAFLVQQRSNSLVPYSIRYTLTGGAQLLDQGLSSKLDHLLHLLEGEACRMDLSQQWRPYTYVRDGLPSGPPLTKMQVLQSSLAQFLRDAPDVSKWPPESAPA